MKGVVAILVIALLAMASAGLSASDASAQNASRQQPTLRTALPDAGASTDGSVTSRIIQTAAVLTALSMAPALLIMLTSFTRFLIALSFLRSGLGLQGAPANLVLIMLALFMTFYVMAPTFEKAWQEGGRPLVENRITEEQALPLIVAPFEAFMRANVREKDLVLFEELAASRLKNVQDGSAQRLRTLVPAFIISELRRSFEIGFLILLPFLVIDLVVSTLVMSMGMMMLSPTVFSMPCKVLFFVMIDGWHVIVGSLVRSFV